MAKDALIHLQLLVLVATVVPVVELDMAINPEVILI